MIIIERPVEVGRHNRPVVCPVLGIVGFTHLDAADLGNGIGFVGGFQRAGEQGLLLMWADEKYGGAGVQDLTIDGRSPKQQIEEWTDRMKEICPDVKITDFKK